jgi:hypothetical protein
MKLTNQSVSPFEEAPAWVKQNLPRNIVLADVPSVLLIDLSQDGCWIVASRLASDVISNPNSHLGSFMRTRCALLALRHVSNN